MTTTTPSALDYQRAIYQIVAAVENLLPGARHIPADIGLINDALLAARPLIDGTATAESLASGEEEPVVALVHQNGSGQVTLRDYHSGDAWDMSRHVGSALVERTVFPRPQWVTRGDV